jgi:hypothetical protein
MVFLGVAPIKAQCYQCNQDYNPTQHELQEEAPPIAWHAEPHGKHLFFLPGYCVFTHWAGCSEEEDVPDLIDQVAELDGQA